jgi:P-type E1-E2 ATPase
MIAPMPASSGPGGRKASTRALVPGDIALLEADEMVPADLRILRARQLLANEAILTGEAVPAGKAAVAGGAVLGDRSSMLYSETVLATGQATALVVATGRQTEIGGIAELTCSTGTITPLLRQINQFAKVFASCAMAASALLLAYTTRVAVYDWVEARVVVVALAVITNTIALGVQRMARRNAIIRHLPAVETLGATSVICSDKTGMLTRNEMTARRLVMADGPYMVEGSDYAPSITVSFYFSL